MRYKAAHANLAIDYDNARRVIEWVSKQHPSPHAGHAGMTLFALDDGIYKPT